MIQDTVSTRRTTPVTSLLLALAVGGLVWLGGCTDQAAQQREQAQQTINTARQSYQAAVSEAAAVPLGAAEDVADIRQKYQQVLGKLETVPAEAAPGQIAAARMLAAAAHLDLAAIDALRAGALETELARDRALAAEQANSAGSLRSLAQGIEAKSFQTQRQQLQASQQQAQSLIQSLNEQIAELEGPIADRQEEIKAAQQRISELRQQSDDLLRQYQEQGRVQGLDDFKAAQKHRRQADQVEYDLAQDELVLEYELQPQQALAQERITKLQEMINSIEQTLTSIDQAQADLNQQAQKTRQQLKTTRDEVSAIVNELADIMSADLADYYDSAQQHLQQAMQSANDAARQLGSNAQTARLQAVQAHVQLGKVLWERARSLAEQAALLQHLVNSGQAVGSTDQYKNDLQALKEEYDATVEQVKVAYQEALDASNQVRGASGEIADLQSGINAALAALKGEQMPAAGGAAGSAGSAGITYRGTGAESPEQIVEWMNTLITSSDPDFTVITNVVESLSVEFPSEEVQQMFMTVRDVLGAFGELDAALQNQFDKSLADMPESQMVSQMLSGGPGVPATPSEINLEVVAGDRAEALAQSPQGEQITIPMERVDGRWYWRLPREIQQMMTAMSAGGGAAGMGGAGAMPPGMQQMLPQIMEAVKKSIGVIEQLAADVRAGDIASWEQFMTALNERMQEIGGDMPGFPGGGGMPGGMPGGGNMPGGGG